MKNSLLEAIPDRVTDTQVLHFLNSTSMNKMMIRELKDYLNLKDETLSDWLNVSVKTFRNYKNSDTALKENTKEQIIHLISLFKHGNEVFGSSESFMRWLNSENQFLDEEKPVVFLNTVTGIRFINDRLTAIEFGDNV
jgi:putative toxin-antitoxin system antitoxin component (TIGR02293 family)